MTQPSPQDEEVVRIFVDALGEGCLEAVRHNTTQHSTTNTTRIAASRASFHPVGTAASSRTPRPLPLSALLTPYPRTPLP